ncbi:MAG: hypothetical protein ACKO0V_13405 [bacterium]
MSAGAAAAVAASQMMTLNAIGGLVTLKPADFLALVQKQPGGLVIHSTVRRSFSGTRQHQYLTSYKGIGFYAKSDDPLPLPPDTELIEAEKIWPGQ